MMTNPARGTDEPVYRMLGPNEIIQPGDQYRYPNGDATQGADWREVKASIGSTPRTGPALARREYRRAIERIAAVQPFITIDYSDFNRQVEARAEFARKVRESSFAHNPAAAHSKFTLGQVNPGPGEGYRALTLGEQVQGEDECWDGSTYRPVPFNVIGCAVPSASANFRRKIESPSPDPGYPGYWGRAAARLMTANKALKEERDKYLRALRDIEAICTGWDGVREKVGLVVDKTNEVLP